MLSGEKTTTTFKLDDVSVGVLHLQLVLLHVWPASSYLCLKTLDQDGHQQVEEDVVAKGHERDEVEGSYGRGGGHTVIQYLVPVLLG